MSSVNVVLKYHDSFDTSELDPKLPLDEHGTSLWEYMQPRFKGRLLIRRLFEGVLGEKLDALKAIATRENIDCEREASRAVAVNYVPPKFENYLWVSLVPEGNGESDALESAVELINRFLTVKAIQYAYIRLPDVPASPPPDPRARASAGHVHSHLKSAPDGVGAQAVVKAKIRGATGQKQTIIDIEFGWFFSHPALLDARGKSVVEEDRFNGVKRAPAGEWGHGTSVLGLLCGRQLEIAGKINSATGIATGVDRVEAISNWSEGQSENPTATAVIKAAANRLETTLFREGNAAPLDGLNRSTVVLIELVATLPDQDYYYPVEIYPDTFDAIKLVTKTKIAVIEPAGNGRIDKKKVGLPQAVDLDALQDNKFIVSTKKMPSFGIRDRPAAQSSPIRSLKRAPQELDAQHGDNIVLAPFEDSGAIMVAAARNIEPRKGKAYPAKWSPTSDSNCGSRIDCFAQGESVSTLNYDSTNPTQNLYTDLFNGTSAASAIIAGAALCVQGMAQENLGAPLSPINLRDALKIGTPSQFPDTDKIGVMPDLLKVAKTHIYQ
jgi:hypothetical protein